MSLRRTALARRTELRRTPLAKTSTRERRAVARPRAKATGPTAAQKRLVAERAAWSCEICGTVLHLGDTWSAEHSFHHRRPRGMGGTSRPDVHAAYDLLLLCGTGTTGCHGYIESHRGLALYSGWLVPQHQDPAEVPVVIHGRGRTRLTTDGLYATPEETP